MKTFILLLITASLFAQTAQEKVCEGYETNRIAFEQSNRQLMMDNSSTRLTAYKYLLDIQRLLCQKPIKCDHSITVSNEKQ